MKKTLKQFIFEELEKGNYITDTQLAKFCGHEPNFYQAELYKQEYRRLQSAKDYFKNFENNKNSIIRHAGRRYFLRDKMWQNTMWYKIPKVYFDYLKEKGIKDV